MSHFTTITTQIRDPVALRGACQELGVELLKDTTARGYGSNVHQGDYVIRLRGPYDVALTRQQDGSYGLTTDWWDGHVERELGPDTASFCSSPGSTRPRRRPDGRATPPKDKRSATVASNSP